MRKSQVRVTSNPLAAEGEPEADLGTCFDNPNHIELPSANQRPAAGGGGGGGTGGTGGTGTSTGPIDTTTYCKRDRVARNSFATKSAIKPSSVIAATTANATTATTTASMAAATMTTTARNEYIFNCP